MLLSNSSIPATLGRRVLTNSSSRLRSMRSLRLRYSVMNSMNAGKAAPTDEHSKDQHLLGNQKS